MLRILIIALAAAVAANTAAARDYQWPVCNGGTHEGFGYRVDTFTGRVAFHAGTDMTGNFGDTVRAARGGKITAAERRGPYGLMIEIDHGRKQRTRYAHLAAIGVKPGQRVAQGQEIGELGSSGRSAGPHLHFEVWRNNVVVDPTRLLPRNTRCSRRAAKAELSPQLPLEPPPGQTAVEPRQPSFKELYAVRFAWPLCDRTGDKFGYRKDMDGKMGFHPGIDLGATAGLPVRAAAAGRVRAAEERERYGLTVEIEHEPGFMTRYAHLGAVRVAVGQAVGRGQVIGAVGATGKTTGPQLHFEIWLYSVVRDPLKFLEHESTCANSGG